MRWRLLLAAFVGGAVLGVAGWFLWPMPPERERSAAELMDIVMWGREPIGGPFTLTDHDGQRRTDVDFRGKLLLVYFGFTACSDVCPTDLQSIAVAVDKLGHTGDAVQPLFITVNPELDTPEQLKSYVALFHPRMIGLTGSRRQIADVSRAYKVYFARTTPGDRTDPNFDHSSLVYIVGTDGKYVGFFPPGTPSDRMVEFLRLKLAARHSRKVPNCNFNTTHVEIPISALGQSRRFGDVCDMSALPPTTAVMMQCCERQKGANRDLTRRSKNIGICALMISRV